MKRKLQLDQDWRSYCPVSRTLDLVGDKWTLVVVRDLLLGLTRYEQFLDRPEKISTNILANRLKRLETLGFVERRQYSEHASRFEYQLTSQGERLRPLVQSIIDWGLANIDGAQMRLRPNSEKPEQATGKKKSSRSDKG
ncbi:winged helix-turn-helix transcriptional regulator [Roseimaritima ulvae]|uniref:Putative HTH-type transcriptional regulator YybR n=1 Tax=Roseimaritima ulvae TaxID=980254 RepID=A0A5B9QTJ1_9BACT|nr:helix-turn-helix domain-containing protein [Roseimaritima ulvae]QEG41232.1 putative HTH-type transcriptional regulator YybR [Roseimaritima ulvae]